MTESLQSSRPSYVTVLAAALFFVVFSAGTVSSSSLGNDDDNDNNNNNNKCGIYLAPSSIPNAGLGMYVGHRNFTMGENVTDGDIIIPVFEMDWHNMLKEDKLKFEHFLWDEYTWNGDVFPGAEEEVDDIDWLQFASPGVGAAANSYISLVNIEDYSIELGLATRPDSPGAGAQTPYHGRYFTAISDIPQGGYIPMPDSYPVADGLLRRFEQMRLRHYEKKRNDETTQQPSHHQLVFWQDLLDLVAHEYSKIWNKSRVLNAMPDKVDTIPDLLQNGGSARRDYNRSIKELSWLEENGQCMDNIKVLGPNKKRSSDESPDAGRGAVANRFIPKDGLVAPAPLVHIPDYDVLKMYKPIDSVVDAEDGNHEVIPDMEGPSQYQLLMNYCFGHEESTLLLCPYGLLTSLINHSSKNANTKITWSNTTMRHREWLEKPIEYFGEEYVAGLQFDFVAMRDIEEDEEILIDYGVAWEKAWRDHVRTFVPREHYVPAFDLNKQLDTLTFRTIKDRPYEKDGIQLRCRIWYVHQFMTEESKKKQEEDDEDSVPCRIIKKLRNDRYRVQTLKDKSDDVDCVFTHDRMLWEVPSDAFFFMDLPYERPYHLDFDAFRHAMMIPDDIFPEPWKNLRH
eukprot:scaffold1284_cov108-Cylindrotheca_fusiformis.AAC.20